MSEQKKFEFSIGSQNVTFINEEDYLTILFADGRGHSEEVESVQDAIDVVETVAWHLKADIDIRELAQKVVELMDVENQEA